MAQLVQFAITAAAAANYDDNDVISASATVGAASQINTSLSMGGSITIKGGHVTSSVEGFVATLRLWLLDQAPHADTEENDGAAFTLAIEDRDKLVGFIDFAASVDAGEFSLGLVASTSLNLSLPVRSGGIIYAILQATDAFTNEAAGMTFNFTLAVEHD